MKKSESTAIAKPQTATEIMQQFQEKTMEVWKDEAAIKEIITGASTHPITPAEFKYYFAYGMFVGANPLIKEIWIVKYQKDAPASIFLGRDFYRRKALEQKNYDGHYAAAVYSKDSFEVVDGIPSHKWAIGDDRGQIKGAYCVVNVKERKRPHFVWVNLNEYTTGKSLWAQRPVTMIQKVAEAQGLRAAFSIFTGTYDASEEWDKEINPENVKLDTKMEVSTEEVRGHDDTGIEKKSLDEKIKDKTGGQLKTETPAEMAEKDAVNLEEKQNNKPDGTKIAQEKMAEEALADASPNTPKDSDAPPMTEGQRKMYVADLLRVQVGNNPDKQQDWLEENCKSLFDIPNVRSWTDVELGWLEELEAEISKMANPE